MSVSQELRECTANTSTAVWLYIRNHESKMKQAEADIRMLGRMGANICPVCAHYNHGTGDPKQCPRALKGEDCFEWRGMKEG